MLIFNPENLKAIHKFIVLTFIVKLQCSFLRYIIIIFKYYKNAFLNIQLRIVIYDIF